MQEIKFRVWHEGKFYYWGFIEGVFKLPYEVFVSAINSGKISISQIQEKSEQYTGLTDKEGKEIYEGDIVTQIIEGHVHNRNLTVEYLNGMSGYYVMKNGVGFHLSYEHSVLNNQLKYIKIVSNIHKE
jgi:uncharacterized phage protein (TIGR01671 family)